MEMFHLDHDQNPNMSYQSKHHIVLVLPIITRKVMWLESLRIILKKKGDETKSLYSVNYFKSVVHFNTIPSITRYCTACISWMNNVMTARLHWHHCQQLMSQKCMKSPNTHELQLEYPNWNSMAADIAITQG